MSPVRVGARVTTSYGTGPYIVTDVSPAKEGPEGTLSLTLMMAADYQRQSLDPLARARPGATGFTISGVVEAGGRWWSIGGALYHARLERKHWRDISWQPDELFFTAPTQQDVQLMEGMKRGRYLQPDLFAGALP